MRKHHDHILLDGCARCGATWDLHVEMEREGVTLPAPVKAFVVGMKRAQRRLEKAHADCSPIELVAL